MTGLTWQYLMAITCLAAAAVTVCRAIWKFWSSAGGSSCGAGCAGCSAVADGVRDGGPSRGDGDSGELSSTVIEPDNIELLYLRRPE